MSRGSENRGGSRGSDKKGQNHRLARVEREIREVIGIYLLSGFRGEVDGMISVTRVSVSSDLRSARVYITLMKPSAGESESADRKAAVEELRAHGHEIQHEVNRKLQMKFCPKLSFYYDEGYDNTLRVENILKDLREKSGSSTESLADEAGDIGGDDDE